MNDRTTMTTSAISLIGASEAMRLVEGDIDRAAQSDAKVLITGETGAGKEVVARLIHTRSARGHGPLLTLNCAGLPDSLLESELFGHVRGSFTGAYRDKPGLLESAPNGTVFLDEVGEMSTRMQAVLLRFLETGEIQRVGADRVSGRVNVRLITATNRDLQKQIESGAFREDLYFRLNVVRIVVPPLRERLDDIGPLSSYFLEQFSRQHRMPAREFTDEALAALLAYRWPGNVRELKNVVERVVLKCQTPAVRSADLPAEITGGVAKGSTRPAMASAPAAPALADQLTSAMTANGESFWSAVYPLFMARDMTRSDLRRIVHFGLEQTNGNYRQLVQFFNMPPEDYKRFLSFLRKHDCHLPFQRFRVAPARLGARPVRASA